MPTDSKAVLPDAAAILLSQAIDAIASRVAQLIANTPSAPPTSGGDRPRYLVLKEAAQYTRLGSSTLRRLQARGDVAKVKVGGRLLFVLEDLDDFMAQHRQPAQHETRAPAQRGRPVPQRHQPEAQSSGESDPFANYRPRATSTRNRKSGRLPQSNTAGDAKA